MRHYATCARARELPVLLASMRKHCRPFVLHVLAWDYDPVGMPFWLPHHDDDPGATVVRVNYTTRGAFLARHPDLEPSRLPGPPRSAVDVVATVRWAFFGDVMESTGEPLVMQDGDIHYFSSPEPVFAEIGAARLAVTPHRIPPRSRGLPGVVLETHACYGRLNTGWSYAADPEPVREQAAAVRAWSYTEVRRHPIDGLPDFGDQGSWERIAARRRAHEIAAPVNIGPWSVHDRPLARGPGGAVTFGGRDLVAYHFSSMRFAPDGSVQQYANACYEIERAPGVVELVYRPYLDAVAAASAG